LTRKNRRHYAIWMPWWMWGIAAIFIFTWKMCVLPFKVIAWLLVNVGTDARRAAQAAQRHHAARQARPGPRVGAHRAPQPTASSALAGLWHAATYMNPPQEDPLAQHFPARGRWE
jgi:hypothetical protein